MNNTIKNIIFCAEQDGIEKVKVNFYQLNSSLRGFTEAHISADFKMEALGQLLEILFENKEYVRGEEIKSDGTTSCAIFYRFNENFWIKIKTKEFENILEDYRENFGEVHIVF